MKDCENLISYLSFRIDQQDIIKKSCQELFLEYCDISLLDNQSFSKFKQSAIDKNYDIHGCKNWDDIFFKIFLNHIEPNFRNIPAIFVYDYPSSQAALAKRKTSQPFFAERFELYIHGIEVANAYSELIDSQEQKIRLIKEQEERKKMKKEVFPIDEEFLASLDSIHQPCSGIALGVDRIIMLLLNKKSINEVILFPITKMINVSNN